jgi:hypothetical protein
MARFDIRLSNHAMQRMKQRGWTLAQVKHAIMHNDPRVVTQMYAVVVTVLPKSCTGKKKKAPPPPPKKKKALPPPPKKKKALPPPKKKKALPPPPKKKKALPPPPKKKKALPPPAKKKKALPPPPHTPGADTLTEEELRNSYVAQLLSSIGKILQPYELVKHVPLEYGVAGLH